jgi:hypothetical protein
MLLMMVSKRKDNYRENNLNIKYKEGKLERE